MSDEKDYSYYHGEFGDQSEDKLSARIEGSDASMFIQWKGTEVCLDFQCICGMHCHYDGYFAYQLRCPDCEREYALGTQVIAVLKHKVTDVNVLRYWNPRDLTHREDIREEIDAMRLQATAERNPDAKGG